MFGFTLTASLTGLEEKLSTDPRIGQWRAVVCVGSPSSRDQWACSTLSMTHERLPRIGITHMKRTPDIRGLVWEAYVVCWSNFLLQGVHRFKSPRLSDMGNRLFVSVIT
jgi:hypothetical protein